ncbi:MAG: SLBB domain-containing protein [Desulfobacterium sp.]
MKNLPPEVIRQLPDEVVNAILNEQDSTNPLYPYPTAVPETLDSRKAENQKSSKNSSNLYPLENHFVENSQQGQYVENDNNTSKNETESKAIDEISLIELQYRSRYASSLSNDLQQFGYDIFRSATSKPSSLAVPDDNYRFGTGDNLLIKVWGSSVDVEYPAMVDREGVINIPKLGPIFVAGVKYGDVEAIVKKEAEKYIQGVNISVTLIELKSLEVYVVGNVENPGLHLLPAFSTIFDGLIYAGGVQKTGTLRGVKLYRGDNNVQSFDLYDLLLKGNRNSDTSLQNKDVIFVPQIGTTAAVAGAVNNQAIFEIIGKNSIKDLVAMAGDILPQAFGDRIHLRRFDKNKEFVVQDINIKDSPGDWNKIIVKDGDLLELKFMDSTMPNVVRLEGNVWQPDVFNYKAGMTLSQILTTTDLLLPETLTDFAMIFRYDRKTTRSTPMRFPLSKVFSGEYDAPLQPYDKIVILSRDKIGIKEEVTIRGAVWNPGKYEFKPDLRLKDALALAGGVKFGAGTDRVEVARQIIKNNTIETEYLLMTLEKDGEFVLHPHDAILIPMIKDAALVRQISLTGELRYPGTYTIRENEKVSDLILRAGGLTEDAYFYGAKYTSEKAREIQQRSIDKMIEQLQLSYMQTSSEIVQTATSMEDAKAAEIANSTVQGLLSKLRSIKAEGRVAIILADLDSYKGSIYDFKLQDGDALDIPQKPIFISVVGSVYSPGSFLYETNKTLDYYLGKSGGAAKTADTEHIYLLKADGEILSMTQKHGFFSKFGDTTLMPGDTIVVPEDLERVPYLKFVKDIADIIFKIATTAGVALAI